MSSPALLEVSRRHRTHADNERELALTAQFDASLSHETAALLHDKIAEYLETWARLPDDARTPTRDGSRR